MTNYKPSQNPVTIGSCDGTSALTVGRLHVGAGDGPLRKTVTAVVHTNEGDPQAVVLDEDDLVDALGRLFPGGELATVCLLDPQPVLGPDVPVTADEVAHLFDEAIAAFVRRRLVGRTTRVSLTHVDGPVKVTNVFLGGERDDVVQLTVENKNGEAYNVGPSEITPQ